MDITLSLQQGPQIEFGSSPADVLIYGGAAGGGKTYALVSDPILQGHYQNPKFTAGIFRRTFPQLKGQGGIWDEARGIYPMLGGRMREGQDLDARFPSGASIAFRHLQHEKTKFDYQGHQFAYLAFDELTHFTESQFFYLLSRNRTTCGIKPYCRATCNPDAGSWVADFIEWWIDQSTGFPIPERSGQLRYFIRENDEFIWRDTPEEICEEYPDYRVSDILSVTFIPALLDDNPALLNADPSYRARLKAQPRVERARLEGGNWLAAEGAIIDKHWIKRWAWSDNNIAVSYHGRHLEIPHAAFRRFATVDTAGTSREKAREAEGDPASYSVCAIWEHHIHRDRVSHYDVLILRHVWRDRVDWNELKQRIPAVLNEWNKPLCIIEDAHYGRPLADELKGFNTQLVPAKIAGMDDTSRGAKLERAIASGFLTRLEDIGIWIPDTDDPWIRKYMGELTAWTGLPKETADQIDASSYACYHTKSLSSVWGGVVK